MATSTIVGCSETHRGGDAHVDANVTLADGGMGRHDTGTGEPDTGTVEPDGGIVEPDAGLEPCATPGAVETEACGMCGTRERFCTAAGHWMIGACEGESGECLPGTIDTIACGNCGTQTARCTTACAWDVTGACTGEGECAPGTRMRTGDGCAAGETREIVCGDLCTYEPASACVADYCATPGALESVTCGMCGTRERFCNSAHTWEYGACSGEGACMPGTSRSTSCGRCGTMPEVCNTACGWMSAGVCSGEGPCTPGDRVTTTTTCAPGEARELECDSGCAFTREIRPCTATCAGPSDCPSGVCMGGFCAPASCTDGVRNGGETDIDCGGTTTCPRCATGRACGATSDCATDTCSSGYCGGAPRCNTGGARVLVYGPGGSAGTGWFPPGTITTVASDAMWRAMTTADFGLYDLIFVASNRCPTVASGVLGTLDDTMGTWGPAVRGRVVVSVDDADLHGGSYAQRYYSNLVDWLKVPGRNADGGRTSLFLTFGCSMVGSAYVPGARGTPERFASVLGSPIAGDGTNYCSNVSKTAAGLGHPVLAGVTSFWSCPFHGGFASLPSDYVPLVTGTTSPSSPVLAARESPIACVP